MTGRTKAVAEEYKSALGDLTFNSKPMINLLTMLAEENSEYAQSIVNVIRDRIKQVRILHTAISFLNFRYQKDYSSMIILFTKKTLLSLPLTSFPTAISSWSDVFDIAECLIRNRYNMKNNVKNH